MRSKISFFNKTVFLKNLTRFWPVWGFYLLVWICVMVLPLISELNYSGRFLQGDYMLTSRMLEAGSYGGVIIGAFMGIASAMALWCCLYSPRSAGFTAALPISREGFFATNFCSGLSWIIGGNLIVFVLTLGVEALGGHIEITYLLQWLAISLMSALFFYGFATFTAMLTGNLIVLPVVFTLLNFSAYIIEQIVRSIIGTFVYGMMPFFNNGTLFDFLSPPVKMILGGTTYSNGVTSDSGAIIRTYHYFNGWGIFAAYFAAGVVFAALALLLYKRRRMESASDTVAIERLKPVFRYCLAAGCAFVIGMLLSQITNSGMSGSYGGVGAAVWMLFYMIIGCAIGYFAAEMLIRKSFRVFRGRWRGFLITCAVFAALTMSLEFDLFGFERRVPEESSVSAVFVGSGYSANPSYMLEERENILSALSLHESIIANKIRHESDRFYSGSYSVVSDGVSYWSIPVTIGYELENGRSMTRYYQINMRESDLSDPNSDYFRLLGIVNSPEAVERRLTPSLPFTSEYLSEFYVGSAATKEYGYQNTHFTSAEAIDFYQNCVIPDMRDGTLGKVWPIQTDEYYETVYACDIYFYLTEPNPGGLRNHWELRSESISFSPSVDSWRTLRWLREHGIEPMLYRDYYFDTGDPAARSDIAGLEPPEPPEPPA